MENKLYIVNLSSVPFMFVFILFRDYGQLRKLAEMFICVQVLRPVNPLGHVSLPNHTFTGQA